MSIMCLTGPCIGCHVARQPRQKSHTDPGVARGSPSALNGPLDGTGVQIGEALLRGQVSPGVIQFSVFGRRDIVCSPLSALPHTGQQKIKWKTHNGGDRDTRESVWCVCVCVYVNVYIIHPNEFSGCLHTGNVPDANVPLSSQLTLKSPGGDTDGVTLLLHPGRLPYSLFPISSLHIPVIALSLSVCTSLSFSDGLRSICLSTFLPGDTSHLTHIC